MIDLQVCIGSACHTKASYNVIQTFQQLIEEQSLHDRLNFRGGLCMKQCGHSGITVTVDGVEHHVNPDEAEAFFTAEVLPRLQTQ
jgi:NADH:ubiquinone oxidoreductase subunit E